MLKNLIIAFYNGWAECDDSYADYVHSMGVLVDMLSRNLSRLEK